MVDVFRGRDERRTSTTASRRGFASFHCHQRILCEILTLCFCPIPLFPNNRLQGGDSSPPALYTTSNLQSVFTVWIERFLGSAAIRTFRLRPTNQCMAAMKMMVFQGSRESTARYVTLLLIQLDLRHIYCVYFSGSFRFVVRRMR